MIVWKYVGLGVEFVVEGCVDSSVEFLVGWLGLGERVEGFVFRVCIRDDK